MGITKPKFQTLDLGALAALAERLAEAAQIAEEQAAAHLAAPNELAQHFRGGASDSVVQSLRRKANVLQSNATALAQLSEAVADTHAGLSASREAVGALLLEAQAQGFHVDDHWRVTDVSGNQGLAREAAWRSLNEQLRAALDGYDSADEGAVRRIRQAVESFTVPQLDSPEVGNAKA